MQTYLLLSFQTENSDYISQRYFYKKWNIVPCLFDYAYPTNLNSFFFLGMQFLPVTVAGIQKGLNDFYISKQICQFPNLSPVDLH